MKAESVRGLLAEADRPVIGGDTEVVLDGEVLGQPADLEEARSMLEALAGREHTVYGGLCILMPGTDLEARQGVETTSVRLRELGSDEIAATLEGAEWRDRAGGYAIQGAGSGLIERVEGDLSNVIGLPLGLLARLAPELLRATRQN